MMELEKKTTASATRAAAAEEQLDHIQKYMTQSTTAYQKANPQPSPCCVHVPPVTVSV